MREANSSRQGAAWMVEDLCWRASFDGCPLIQGYNAARHFPDECSSVDDDQLIGGAIAGEKTQQGGVKYACKRCEVTSRTTPSAS